LSLLSTLSTNVVAKRRLFDLGNNSVLGYDQTSGAGSARLTPAGHKWDHEVPATPAGRRMGRT